MPVADYAWSGMLSLAGDCATVWHLAWRIQMGLSFPGQYWGLVA